MQLEKEKKEKQERERCRALAQRIAEEAAAASAALLGEQSLLLTKALRRAGVAAEAWAEGSEAELLVVVDPAYETLPEKLPQAAPVLCSRVSRTRPGRNAADWPISRWRTTQYFRSWSPAMQAASSNTYHIAYLLRGNISSSS